LDTLTHTVLGACIGEAIAGKKLGKKAMLIGAIANNIPDIDVVSSFWLRSPDSLLAHRGFTHSILFLILFAPAASYYLSKFKKWHILFRDWFLLIGSGILVHIFIDAFTSYGTGWFEPFSHHRVSFNTIFIVDPLYTIAPLILAIVLSILKRTNRRRFALAMTAIFISSGYLLCTAANKIHIDKLATESFKKNNFAINNYFTTPTPLNNFLWYIVAMDSAGANIGYYSVFDKTEDISGYHYFPKNDTALVPLKDRREVLKLIRFSQGFYIIENKKDLLVFNDLRFGQIGGWYIPDAPFVFRYNLFKDENNANVLQQGRMKASNSEALVKMIERIRGR